jgi:hypothetical protein
MVRWATPSQKLPPSEVIDKMRRNLISYHIGDVVSPFTGGGVLFEVPRQLHTGSDNWVISRWPMNAAERRHGELMMKVGDKILWDGRFYISLHPPSTSFYETKGIAYSSILQNIQTEKLKFMVRPFLIHDYHNILYRLQSWRDKKAANQVRNMLNHFMRKMPASMRHSIPCVVLVQDNGDLTYVVNIPSLNIQLEKGLVDVHMSLRSHARVEMSNQEVMFNYMA